jgi:hypothetical protein
MKTRLETAIELISGKNLDSGQRVRLGELRDELRTAERDLQLNSVRNQLAAEFNGYAEGRMLFGPQIGPTEAAPGLYRMLLTVNGQTHEGTLTVRADPLKTERW